MKFEMKVESIRHPLEVLCLQRLFGIMDGVDKPQLSRKWKAELKLPKMSQCIVYHAMYLKNDFTQSMQCQDVLNKNKKSPRQRPQPCPALKTDWF